jgi:opacity protein-like surface antigen
MRMRIFQISALIGTLAALTPVVATAQGTWTIGIGVSRDAFTGASTDTTTIPGVRVEVAPAPRLAVELGVARSAGAWEVGLQAGYASGSLRAKTDALMLDDRTGSVTRWRLSLLADRRLATFEPLSVLLLAGPAVEHWEVSGIGNRTTFSGRAGFALRIPLGRLSLENNATLGVGGSPFRPSDLPPEAEVRRMLTWSVGAGIRLAL